MAKAEESHRFAGAEILFELIPPMLVGKAKHHKSLKKMENAPEYKWGMKDARDLETWSNNITYLEEWDYYDFYKARWKWFGFISRLPFIRSNLSARIVHLRFG